MIRSILGVVLGYATWSVLWLAGCFWIWERFPETYGPYAEGGKITALAPLSADLGLSVVCSLLAGRVAVGVARRQGAVLVLACFLLATGIVVQLDIGGRMPLWYHLTFLVLLLPATAAGGKLKKS